MDDFKARVASTAGEYPLPEGVKYSYGTAGFRTVGKLLPPVAYRMGMFAAMRSRKVSGSGPQQASGVVISASHNAHPDNGFKLIDCSGAMLPQEWEKGAAEVANAASADDIVAALSKVADEFGTAPFGPALVHVGRDTRETGPALLSAFLKGVEVAGAKAVDHGIVTTPQVHFCVWQTNVRGGAAVDEGVYLDTVVEAFRGVTKGEGSKAKVTIDCSNGVGYPQMAKVKDRLAAAGLIPGGVELRNGDVATPAKLNSECGADFVQKEKVAPKHFAAGEFGPADHLVSYDGDADRIVYFSFGKDGGFQLVDGDRIAVLYAVLIRQLLDGVAAGPAPLPAAPRVGVIQTAYANGASTKYMRETLGLEVACVPTGVKHLHHKAIEYDIGVYFEANGHGSVVMSDSLVSSLEKAAESCGRAKQLLAVSKLASPVCGDAITDMLLCEAALSETGWSIRDWIALYADAPSRMTKVTVPDPGRVETIWDQTRTTAPAALQPGIDKVVAQYNERAPGSSRAFVRPSGTEPIVRVYAEGDSQANADALAKDVEAVVVGVLSSSL
eukprot:TRINITY_DN5641_c0_g1_i1.p1 TRINITY_DN5641_c0_g1~~TRINITY_DN5641_c0_g1_i1.p1  ORF type:complete len:555 (+),score=187.32 TRINITY_DN5641_c0_g1_i1:73-1737(+)